jgi:hypothetical protein
MGDTAPGGRCYTVTYCARHPDTDQSCAVVVADSTPVSDSSPACMPKAALRTDAPGVGSCSPRDPDRYQQVDEHSHPRVARPRMFRARRSQREGDFSTPASLMLSIGHDAHRSEGPVAREQEVRHLIRPEMGAKPPSRCSAECSTAVRACRCGATRLRRSRRAGFGHRDAVRNDDNTAGRRATARHLAPATQDSSPWCSANKAAPARLETPALA